MRCRAWAGRSGSAAAGVNSKTWSVNLERTRRSWSGSAESGKESRDEASKNSEEHCLRAHAQCISPCTSRRPVTHLFRHLLDDEPQALVF